MADLQKELLESLGAAASLDTETNTEVDTYADNYRTSATGNAGTTSSVEEKALNLLGSGVNPQAVAAACGVSAARISQLLANKEFSDRVSQQRYEKLQEHTKRDNKYDSLEDKLLNKLEKSLPLMVKPDTILKAMQVVNGAKRRGQTAPETTNTNQTVVNIVLPTSIKERFVTNVDNQVIKAGEQELLTMPSGNLLKQVEDAQEAREQKSLPES